MSRVLSTLFRAQKILRNSCSSRKNPVTTYSQWKQMRLFSSKNEEKINETFNEKTNDRNVIGDIGVKYKIFDDKDSSVILDVEEERKRITLQELDEQFEELDPYAGLNLERGRTGVYNIEDLLTVLQKDNAKDIFVASVPFEYGYVDYIVVATGISNRHMKALSAFVVKVYKRKKWEHDQFPKIEGKDSKDWIALDLGNIALHIFSPSARKYYDLETLWSVGSQYDDKSQILIEPTYMDQYNDFLKELEPADTAQ